MHFSFGVGSRVSGMDFLEKLILSMVYSQTQGTSYSFHTHYLSLCRSIGSLEHFSFEEGRFSGIDLLELTFLSKVYSQALGNPPTH